MALRNPLHFADRRTVVAGSLLFITAFSTSAALAAPKQLEKIIVWGESPAETVVGRTSIAAITETTLQYHVRYDDLDLATRDGADALRERVIDAAKQACADLDRMSVSWSKDIACVRSAEKSARAQIEDTIRQAQSGR